MPFQTLPNGQSINYIEHNPQGSIDIVFVHGNFSSLIWWNDVLQLLKPHQKYHLLAIDQRGFGKSTYKNPATKFLDYAEDLKQFCLQKNLKNVTLIGWSFGGGVVMKTAQIAPQIIKNIIPTASVSHRGLIIKDLENNSQPRLTKQSIAKDPKIQFSLKILEEKNHATQLQVFQTVLFNQMPKDYPLQKKKQLVSTCFQQAQYLDVLYILANSDIDVEKIKAKCLMIHGKDDLVIQLNTVEETGKLLGGFEVWEGHSHVVPIEDPKRYAERIMKFVDEQNGKQE